MTVNIQLQQAKKKQLTDKLEIPLFTSANIFFLFTCVLTSS